MNATIEKSGRILTFYSFKGGSGRTMALANEAVLLARAGSGFVGNKVLMIDWDLEAPGLHEFFKENLPDGHVDSTGVIDLFMQVNEQFPLGMQDMKDPAPVEAHIREFFEKSAVRLKQKRTSAEQKESERPTLSEDMWLLKAGLFGEHFALNVQTFDWRGFFSSNYAFFPLLIDYLEKNYDYVLIDSRTGHTDSGGICTSILPEVLVTVFTPTNQGLRVTEVAERAVNYRKSSDDFRPLVIYPLASRIDTSAEALKNKWQETYIPRFEQLFKSIYHLKECDLRKYFGKIEVHYVTDLAYGESVAVMADSGTINLYNLPARYNELAQLIVAEYLPWEMPELTDPRLLTPADHVTFAQQLAANKEFKRAEKHFNQALRLEGEPFNKYFIYLAFAHYFQGRGELDKAEAVYEDLVKAVPEFIAFQSFAGFLLDIRHDYQKARKVAEMALDIDRSSVETLLLYAKILANLSLVEDAEKIYQDAMYLKPEDQSPIARYADFLRDTKKDFRKSEELFRKLVAEDDEPEVWQVNLAQVMLLQGKEEEADRVIQAVLFQKNAPVTTHVLCLIWFLRLAYFPEWYKRSIEELKQTLRAGARWTTKNFDADIAAAVRNRHPYLESVKDLAAKINNPDPIDESSWPSIIANAGKKVFISYNHRDSEVARQICTYLEQAGNDVIIDQDDMAAGRSIMEFIQDSIKKSDAVVSIVSSKSLASGWVGHESVASIYAMWLADKKFIPVKLDNVVFDIDFQISATEALAMKIKELKAKIKKLESLGVDSPGSRDDLTRMVELKNNLGKIIQRFTSVLTLDISGDNFEPNMKRVLASIQR